MEQLAAAASPRYINPKDYPIQSHFTKFNGALFGGAIGHCSLVWDRHLGDKLSGLYHCRHRDNKLTVGSARISLCPVFKRTTEMFDGILLHEMIHAYLAEIGFVTAQHNYLFQHKYREISRKVDFEIPLVDNGCWHLPLADEPEPKQWAAILSEFRDGRWGVNFLPSETFTGAALHRHVLQFADTPVFKEQIRCAYFLRVDTNLHTKYPMEYPLTQVFHPTAEEALALKQAGEELHRLRPGDYTDEYISGYLQNAIVRMMKYKTGREEIRIALFDHALCKDPTEMEKIIDVSKQAASDGVQTAIWTTKCPILYNDKYFVNCDATVRKAYTVEWQIALEMLKGYQLDFYTNLLPPKSSTVSHTG